MPTFFRLSPVFISMFVMNHAWAVSTQQPAVTEGQSAAAKVDSKWLEKLPEEDRAAIDRLIGYAPPPFAEGLKWFETSGADWTTMRGKVIVVQSWTTGATASRGWPNRVANALKEASPNDVVIIALHTPENADGAETFMKRQKPPENVKVLIDTDGAYCDALGIYKHPVNFLVDRHGTVRYAGLNLNGLKGAVAELTAEIFDAKKMPLPRPQEKPAEVKDPEKATGFPVPKGSVAGATDLRGKRAPDFAYDSWYTTAPNPAGKVVMITFWSSIDDAASLNTHAALNNLASRYGERFCVVAVSGDSSSSFDNEVLRRRMGKSDFKYFMALDRNSRMARAMSVAAAPYSVIMSKDWIVRWQGRPSELRPDTVQQILDADAAATAPIGGAAKKRGWKTE